LLFWVEGAPDETTVCMFRYLPERHKFGKTLLTAVTADLRRSGIKIAKGQQWYLGIKAHVVMDSRTKLVQTMLASTANLHDRDALPHLLPGQAMRIWGDHAYQRQTAVILARAPDANEFRHGDNRVRNDRTVSHES
jgi:IS5 family transposase